MGLPVFKSAAKLKKNQGKNVNDYREFYGEYQRWYDLGRTKTLKDRLVRYNPIAGFQEFHVLRPIPQSQINLVTTGSPYTQNPGY